MDRARDGPRSVAEMGFQRGSELGPVFLGRLTLDPNYRKPVLIEPISVRTELNQGGANPPSNNTQAISGLEGSPNQDINRLRSSSLKHDTDLSHDGSEEISSQIQRQFIEEIELAEELAKNIEPGNTKMPDAMETIFEAALDLGKLGGVKEVMGEIENAGNQYSKAVRLLVFLLVEAPMLILNPPLSLTNSVRYRLRTYIDILSRRLKHLQSPRRSSGAQMQGSSLAMMNKQP